MDSAGNKFWLHQDALGSVKAVTNASGDTVSTYKYYPFGDSLTFRGSATSELRFTGKQNIAGIEAYDFSARYYDPELGRFYSIDPMGSAATSPYAYCSNNPVNRVDPTGMVDQSAGYPGGWTDFRYNRYQAWDMYNNRGRGGQIVGGEDGSMEFGGAPNWGLWRGSSQSYTQHLRSIGHPDYSRWRQNEIDSYWMSYYAKHDYYRTYDLDKVTVTEKFWDVCRQGEGSITHGMDYIYSHNDLLRGFMESEMAAARQVQGYDLAAYLNFNISGGLPNGAGATLGWLYDENGDSHFYIGPGASTPGVGFSWTRSEGDISHGSNWGFGGECIGAGQKSHGKGGWSTESGVGGSLPAGFGAGIFWFWVF